MRSHAADVKFGNKVWPKAYGNTEQETRTDN